jgi:ribonucleotide monophosphatase NagD (HAD superfamily)
MSQSNEECHIDSSQNVAECATALGRQEHQHPPTMTYDDMHQLFSVVNAGQIDVVGINNDNLITNQGSRDSVKIDKLLQQIGEQQATIDGLISEKEMLTKLLTKQARRYERVWKAFQ